MALPRPSECRQRSDIAALRAFTSGVVRCTGFRASSLVGALLSSTALVAVSPASAQNLPTGANVAAGSVAIAQPSATQLNITQSSQSAVVNWQGFSVGQGSAVNIAQPNASSAILNRVTGNSSSTIAGSVNANGQVYLVNPNGIAITRSGTVNTGGGFVASTLGISDADFMAGKRSFTGNGASAAVSNAGAIRVGRGGYAALIGGTVSNAGSIDVPLGKVGLGSGEKVTLDFAGDGFLQVAMPTHAGGKGALIRNSGSINANGGSVVISAATAREAARNAVNISGVVQARSIGGHNGSIVIGGGDGGRVKITGRLIATSRHHDGGTIQVTGRSIRLAGATVDASGKTGGGTIDIGGGRQGQGPLQHADTTRIDKFTVIRADATQSGNGGHVVVWSDQVTDFSGTISATGGTLGGNGGEAEVSSHGLLGYSGLTDLTASNGAMGTLLLDPYAVTIVAGSGGTISGGTFTPTANSSLGADTLTGALASANVTVSTGTTGAGTGSITLNSGVSLTWTSTSTLTLDASRNAAGTIALNGAITATNGGLTVKAGTNGAVTDTASLNVKTFTLTSGNWSQNSATLPSFSATNFVLTAGTFLRTTGGTGSSTATPYLISDVYGLQGMATLPTSNFALANDIDASGTSGWNSGSGFSPIGKATSSNLYFTGTFDGQGHTISNLYIKRAATDYVGLFGDTLASSIKNVTLTGAQITGRDYTGAIIGDSDANPGAYTQLVASGSVTGRNNVGGIIGDFYNAALTSSSFSGSVSATGYVGGLVGLPNNGTISQSFSTATVTGGSYAGGLVGYMNGLAISNSYATGAVTGTGSGSSFGGLVGSIGTGSGSVQSSYATGNVSGYAGVGGLVGYASSSGNSISQSYATGNVTTTSTSLGNAGGLVGDNAGSISKSYATGSVTGVNDAQVGGLVGSEETTGVIADTYAMGSVTTTGSGSGGVGGLVGALQGSAGASNVITRSYATGRLVGSTGTAIGGLIGANYGAAAGRITSNYYDFQTAGVGSATISGVGTGAGSSGLGSAVGMTTMQLQAALPNAFSSSVWGIVAGQTFPYFNWQYATAPQAISGIAYTNAGLTALAGGSVGLLVNGSGFGTVSTGNNGYYYFLVPAGTGSGAQVLAYSSGASAGATFQESASAASLTGLNIFGTYFKEQAAPGSTALSTLSTDLATAIGGNTTVQTLVNGLANREIDIAAANFAIDQSVSTGALVLSSIGTVTQSSGAINATGLALLGSAGNFALNQSGNVIGTLAVANAGTVSLYDSGNLSIGTVGSTSGITAITLSLTLASGKTASQTSAINASLQLLGAGATYTLTNASNSIATVAANTGSVSLNDAASLTIGTVGATTGITATGAVTLTTTGATSDLAINSMIATPAGTLTLTSGRNISAAGAVNVGTFILQAGNWSQNAAVLPSFAAGDFRLNGGTFLRVTGGAGTASMPYTINDVYGLQGVATNVTQSFALAGNIDASGTANWNGGAGFAPIGGGSKQFSGGFDGQGHTINGLVINRPSTNFVGLFGSLFNATVANVGIVGGSVSGSVSVGGLAGYQSGGSITRTFSTATVNGLYDVGGLVGYQDSGNVSLSYAAGAVTGTNDYVGGLVGSQSGNISQSYATGSVTGANSVGGLVGDDSFGAITQSYAAGHVVGTGNVGGLVGSSSYATVTSSYWDLQTSGQGTSAGGSGLMTAQMQDLSSFQTTYSGWDFQNVWAPPNQAGQSGIVAAYYPQLYALTAVAWDAADSKTRTYGDSNPPLTATIHGGPASYIFGPANDTLAISTAVSTTASQTSGVGSYAIANTTPATATSSGGVMYRVVSTGSSLTVTPRALTVTADAQSRAYGDANPTLTYQVGGGGLVNGDSLSGALTTSATTLSNVGGYAITQGTLAASNNYALTYTGANLAVTPRALTITANAQSRAYGDANPASGSATGDNLVNGDSIASVSLSSPANATSSVGSYGLTGSAAVFGNGLASNYTISYATLGNGLSVTPRALTVTADAQSRVYGDANPALTYQVGGGGLVNGDALSGALATAATTASAVGNYAITQNTLAASTNYALTYTGANLAVTPRALTVTADAQSRIYGDANPALTYQVGGRGLVNGDTLSGALATAATTASGVGNYAITQNTLAASANYTLSYTGANLAVTPRPLTVTADAQSRAYGDANPATGGAVGDNLVNGDRIASIGLSSSASVTSNVGKYDLTSSAVVFGNGSASNYAINYATLGAGLSVIPRALTVTADPQFRVFGDPNPSLTYRIGSGGLVDGDVLTGALATLATPVSAVGNYAITQGTLAASPNYQLSYVGSYLEVVPAAPVDVASLSSSVVRDDTGTLSLADGVLPVFETWSDIPQGTGRSYTDPRFDQVLVCLGGSGKAAPPCVRVRPQQ